MKHAFVLSFFWLFLAHGILADAFIDRIVEINYGDYAGFGQSNLPDCILGPPSGAGFSGGSLDVLSLGNGGSITLEFVDNPALNGEGPDLIIFENAFFVGGDPENTFAEAAFVEVSQDGVSFFRFPNDFIPDGQPINHPSNWRGYAGILPVLSHPDNEIDPTDPSVAGGDPFEFDDVGLDWIRFVRIIDTNEPPDAATDDGGDTIYDPAITSEGNSGFDLDAICAVHSGESITPTPQQSPTPPSTPTSTSTQSATPTPSSPELNLSLSDTHFDPGDHFLLNLNIFNPSGIALNVEQFVVLDVQNSYFFWPSWSDHLDYYEMEFPAGQSTQTLLSFIWPDAAGDQIGLIIWAALLDSDLNLVGNVDSVEFSY